MPDRIQQSFGASGVDDGLQVPQVRAGGVLTGFGEVVVAPPCVVGGIGVWHFLHQTGVVQCAQGPVERGRAELDATRGLGGDYGNRADHRPCRVVEHAAYGCCRHRMRGQVVERDFGHPQASEQESWAQFPPEHKLPIHGVPAARQQPRHRDQGGGGTRHRPRLHPHRGITDRQVDGRQHDRKRREDADHRKSRTNPAQTTSLHTGYIHDGAAGSNLRIMMTMLGEPLAPVSVSRPTST
jgi:hypothetical protein